MLARSRIPLAFPFFYPLVVIRKGFRNFLAHHERFMPRNRLSFNSPRASASTLFAIQLHPQKRHSTSSARWDDKTRWASVIDDRRGRLFAWELRPTQAIMRTQWNLNVREAWLWGCGPLFAELSRKYSTTQDNTSENKFLCKAGKTPLAEEARRFIWTTEEKFRLTWRKLFFRLPVCWYHHKSVVRTNLKHIDSV